MASAVRRRTPQPIANRVALRAIRRTAHPLSGSLYIALESRMRATADELEAQWIAKIEAVRAELEASDEELRTEAWERSGDLSQREVLRETVGECCKAASKKRDPALLLFRLVRTLRPQNIVELGTCLGVSTAYQAAAQHLNGSGRIATFEASRARISIAKRALATLSLDDIDFHTGRFQDTLVPALRAMPTPVDYAFIDGHHEEEPTISYFSEIARYADERTLLVFDDIHWSAGMDRAWQRIYTSDRIALSVEVREIGICLMGAKQRSNPVRIKLW